MEMIHNMHNLGGIEVLRIILHGGTSILSLDIPWLLSLQIVYYPQSIVSSDTKTYTPGCYGACK